MRTARRDPALCARVTSVRPLHYSDGADAREDRPGHVRAGSALAWVGGRLLVVQDDASFFALVDGAAVAAVALPDQGGLRLFDDARGNKHHKLDLEAVIALPDRVVAFGSGSTAARERLVSFTEGQAPTVRSAGPLYARLRDEAFSGSELNLEGACAIGDAVWLFQRGNGAPRGGVLPRDATAWVDRRALEGFLDGGPAPALRDVTAWDLGALDGVRLTFTDGAARRGALAFLAAAEASPDAVRDGPVRGVALGLLGPDGGRWARLEDASGAPFLGKAEGLAFDPADPCRAFVVVDRDDPEAPAELCTVTLTGPWDPVALQQS